MPITLANTAYVTKGALYDTFSFIHRHVVYRCLQACSNEASDNPLDPDKPISITLWHYYSGNTKMKFDELVDQFNETVGLEKGILVDAQSQGDIERLETAVLPYPVFEGGKKTVSQQGAGMVIVNSDYEHELAASEFLKWFTDVEQNRTFAAATAYFPVKDEALKEAQMLQAVREEQSFTSSALNSSITTTSEMLNSYYLYGYPAFDNSYELRELLETHLYEWVMADQRKLAGLEGDAYNEQLFELLSPDNFENWYAALLQDIRTTTTVPTVGEQYE